MDAERKWLVYSSLAVSFAAFAFFCSAPAVGYPLKWPDAIGLLQITLPVFVGYLGAASVWAFGTTQSADPAGFEINPIRRALIRGPVALVLLMLIVVFAVFGYSNSGAATDGSGMTIGQLTTFVTTALGILTATTGVGMAALFPHKDEEKREKDGKRAGTSL